MDCNCIFCKIVNQEIPAYKVYEDAYVLAFLDINPMSDGHTIIIPKVHVTRISLSSDEILQHCAIAMKLVSQILAKKLLVDNFNYLCNNGKISGQEIEHLHFHVIPKYEQGKGFEFDAHEKNIKDVKIIYEKIMKNN